MWRGVPETVEVRLGRIGTELTYGFVGTGPVKTEDTSIVETMAVSLACEPRTFDIEARSPKDQLVKRDLLKGTALQGDDFGKWVWLVTPLKRGNHTLLVTVSAAIRDSRGLPATSTLPDKTFPVKVRVKLMRALFSTILRAVPGILWAVVTTLVGILTKDYWWPVVRDLIGL